eukprot:scaffold27966_cov84-Isochrysis_galbana.AAC.1
MPSLRSASGGVCGEAEPPLWEARGGICRLHGGWRRPHVGGRGWGLRRWSWRARHPTKRRMRLRRTWPCCPWRHPP